MFLELWEKQKPLMMAGAISLACCVLLAVISLFDSTQILGINRWTKPMKFFISITIFVWTIAVYLKLLPGFETVKRRISWAMIAIFFIEMFIIVLQAARGTTSHFNRSTPLNANLFRIMAVAIVSNALISFYLLYLYLKAEIDLPKAVLWGLRLGLIVFLLGNIEGGFMSVQTGHSVGVADGGAGLPVVNWSTRGGDLRIAHFIGMHALQAIPIFAYLTERLKVAFATALTFVFAFVYSGFFTFVFVEAVTGQPFLSKLF